MCAQEEKFTIRLGKEKSFTCAENEINPVMEIEPSFRVEIRETFYSSSSKRVQQMETLSMKSRTGGCSDSLK